MFLFKNSFFLEEMETHSNDIYNFCKRALDNKKYDLQFQRLDKQFFIQCEDISFDKAIMEKTNNGIVLSLNAGWNDIGSWLSLWEIAEKDNKGNFTSGKVYLSNVSNS